MANVGTLRREWGASRALTVVVRRVDHKRYMKPAVRRPRPPSVAFESSREVPLPRISGIFTAHMAHNCENETCEVKSTSFD
jgi:hypothetical protein